MKRPIECADCGAELQWGEGVFCARCIAIAYEKISRKKVAARLLRTAAQERKGAAVSDILQDQYEAAIEDSHILGYQKAFREALRMMEEIEQANMAATCGITEEDWEDLRLKITQAAGGGGES